MARDRQPLSHARVVSAAVEMADAQGLDAVSMRTLADSLGVVPMALYKHVANKDALLTAMVDDVIAQMRMTAPASGDWKADARAMLMAARRAQHLHPWAWAAIETRSAPTPVVLDHMERMISTLRGGLSAPLTHQVMHALGSRLWGFSQEVFSSPPPSDPDVAAAAAAMLAQRWPRVLESAMSARHDSNGIVGPGCDDEAEFEFAIDLILDGAERLQAAGGDATAAVSSP